MLTLSAAVRDLVEFPRNPGDARAAAVCLRTPEQTLAGVVSAEGAPAEFTEESPFILYSVTKSLLAIVALRLVARAVVTLDDPIARWVPSVPNATRITLRQLLRHASGLPDYGGLVAYREAVRRGDEPWSVEEYFARTDAATLLFAPGQGWRYSNIGYMAVRLVIEAVQAASFAEVFAAEVGAPLGLRETFVVTTAAQLGGLTFGPSFDLGTPEQPVTVAGHYHPGWVAHGVAASTMREATRIFAALFAGELLTPPLLREMCTYTPLPFMPDRPVIRPGYGMGIQIDQGWAEGPVYGNSGGGPGAKVSVMHLLREGMPLTVAVATPGEDIAQPEAIAAQTLRDRLADEGR